MDRPGAPRASSDRPQGGNSPGSAALSVDDRLFAEAPNRQAVLRIIVWPWGHLAVGYVLYSLFTRIRYGRPPDGLSALMLAFGTQFPDLIDKPLAWTFHILASGRSLAHSLFTTLVVIAVITWYARRRERLDLAGAFAIGYLSHLVTDGFGSYLFWPLLPGPSYTPDGGILAFFRQIELTPSVVFQLILALVVFGIWLWDGAPGIGVLRSWLPSWLSRETNPNR